VLNGVVGALSGIYGAFVQLFGILFIAIYLLADSQRFQAAYLGAVPGRYRPDALALWNDLSQSLTRYLNGLVLSMTIQGVMAWIGLSLLGVPYAFLFGLWMAVTALLPYVGAWLGAIPAVIAALYVSPLTALLTAGMYLVINQIEGNILTPRIQGEAVKVHPLGVFLAVVAGGEIGGLLGAVCAVPILAVVRVLLDFFAARLRVQDPSSGATMLVTDPESLVGPTAAPRAAPEATTEPQASSPSA
jgi:predicted PurR-regulated permease PerM